MERVSHQSNNNDSYKRRTCGYFTGTIHANSQSLLSNNNERAFVVTQIQDLLSLRSLLEDPAAHKKLAAHIDLLGYSITKESIKIIAFSISAQSIEELLAIIRRRLEQYKTEYSYSPNSKSPQPNMAITSIRLRHLDGPHHALLETLNLHASHKDWEYDRYSSIGFYLHDRRGDWMRIWRLSNLYENDSQTYHQLMRQRIASQAEVAPLQLSNERDSS